MPQNTHSPAVPRVTGPITDQTMAQQAVEGPRKLNFDRDQVLNRLWELASLPSEATRGSITGQVKAISIIAAIEGFIPDRRSSTTRMQPAATPVEADIYQSEWLRNPKQQPADEETGDSVAAAEPQPPTPPMPDPASATVPNQPNPADSLLPKGFNWVPLATNGGFDGARDTRQPFSIQKGRFGRRR